MTRSQRIVLAYIRDHEPVCRVDIIRARLGVSPSSIERAIYYAYRMVWIYETAPIIATPGESPDHRRRWLCITEMGRLALGRYGL